MRLSSPKGVRRSSRDLEYSVAAGSRWRRFGGVKAMAAKTNRRRMRRLLRAIALVALVPPFALAFFSLTQPWARARVVLVLGIARSVEATQLVVGSLAAAL